VSNLYYINWKGHQEGPFTREEIETRLGNGQITPLHAVLLDGKLVDTTDWLSSLHQKQSEASAQHQLESYELLLQEKEEENRRLVEQLQAQPPPPLPPSFPQNPSPAPPLPQNNSLPSTPPPPPPPPHTLGTESPAEVSTKSRVAFILLGVFLGGFGAHNFYIGRTGRAVTQLLLCLFLFWTIIAPVAVGIWVIVELITTERDSENRKLS
jgi:hypothetical protein